MNIPFFDFGGTGKNLHFLHANGYPPACYDPLLQLLSTQYHVFGMSLRPLWKRSNPADIKDWNPLTDDFLKFLNEKKTGRLIGMGHSIGAIVTLRAAVKEPDRFHALVLIEPVIFPLYFMLEWNLARTFSLGHRLHPKIEGALKRRREFDDLDQLFKGYRHRAIFRFFSDENLRIFIRGMTKPKTTDHDGAASKAGYELAYSPEWEAQIYQTGLWHDWDLWLNIPRLDIPTLILRGAETDTFWDSTARSVGKRNRKIRIVTLEKSTHLLPLEKPQEVFDATKSFLDEVSKDPA
jgi:pimeloyl-ACP methyl ester carboxylesterase